MPRRRGLTAYERQTEAAARWARLVCGDLWAEIRIRDSPGPALGEVPPVPEDWREPHRVLGIPAIAKALAVSVSAVRRRIKSNPRFRSLLRRMPSGRRAYYFDFDDGHVHALGLALRNHQSVVGKERAHGKFMKGRPDGSGL